MRPLHLAAENGSVEDLERQDMIEIGCKDIKYVGRGRPEPGVGRAGRGII